MNFFHYDYFKFEYFFVFIYQTVMERQEEVESLLHWVLATKLQYGFNSVHLSGNLEWKFYNALWHIKQDYLFWK